MLILDEADEMLNLGFKERIYELSTAICYLKHKSYLCLQHYHMEFVQ